LKASRLKMSLKNSNRSQVQRFKGSGFRGFVFTANLSTEVQIELYVVLDQQYITNAESDCV